MRTKRHRSRIFALRWGNRYYRHIQQYLRWAEKSIDLEFYSPEPVTLDDLAYVETYPYFVIEHEPDEPPHRVDLIAEAEYADMCEENTRIAAFAREQQVKDQYWRWNYGGFEIPAESSQ